MATASTDVSSSDIDLRAVLSSVVDSYRHMEMSIRRYLLLILVPSTVFLFGTLVAVLVFSFPVVVAAPLVLLGGFAFLTSLVYPKIVRDRKRNQIRARFHLFLTHITVLSMANIDRVEMFRTLANEDEYGALADEMGRIVALVDTWNQSIEDATRMRSKRVPSPLLADFFERLSYTIGAGQSINEFLMDEQDSIIQEFVIRYQNDLAKLDVMKELYLSMMMSTTFILVFSILIPFLLGINAMFALTGVIGLFATVQTGFVVVVHSVAPTDPVWYLADTADEGPVGRTTEVVLLSVALMLVLTVGVGLIFAGMAPIGVLTVADDLPLAMFAAIPLTPLLLPGIYMRRKETAVKERDSEFPSFIRALGAVESVKQTSTSNVLGSLRRKDFGALTHNIDNLFKRLRVRVDSRRAWRLFAAETGSNLIQKFGEMYVVGRQMGGRPKQLGQIISKNMNEVLKVREQRRQTARTFIGVIYGITFAAVFAFFVGLEVVKMLIDITSQMNLDQSQISFILNTAVYNLQAIRFLLTGVILINAILSAIMIRLVDRGHFLSGMLHFVLLTWLSAITAWITRIMVSSLINV